MGNHYKCKNTSTLIKLPDKINIYTCRADRSCENHVFTLSSIIINNKQVFTAYIDLKSYFDYKNRDMLLYKLLVNGIDGKLYDSIRNTMPAQYKQCI